MKKEYVVCGSCSGTKTGPDGFICLSCSGTGKVIWLENLIRDDEIKIYPFVQIIEKNLQRIIKKYKGDLFFKHQKKYKSDINNMLKIQKEKYKFFTFETGYGSYSHMIIIYLNEKYYLEFEISRSIKTGKANEQISYRLR